jgi:hypothetical protein
VGKIYGATIEKEWISAKDSRKRTSHQHIDEELKGIDEPYSNGLMFLGDQVPKMQRKRSIAVHRAHQRQQSQKSAEQSECPTQSFYPLRIPILFRSPGLASEDESQNGKSDGPDQHTESP